MVLFFRIFGSMDSNQNLFSSMVFCQFWTANDVTLSLSLFLFFSVNSLCVLNIPCCRGGGFAPRFLLKKLGVKRPFYPWQKIKNKLLFVYCIIWACVCACAHTHFHYIITTHIYSHITTYIFLIHKHIYIHIKTEFFYIFFAYPKLTKGHRAK